MEDFLLLKDSRELHAQWQERHAAEQDPPPLLLLSSPSTPPGITGSVKCTACGRLALHWNPPNLPHDELHMCALSTFRRTCGALFCLHTSSNNLWLLFDHAGSAALLRYASKTARFHRQSKPWWLRERQGNARLAGCAFPLTSSSPDPLSSAPVRSGSGRQCDEVEVTSRVNGPNTPCMLSEDEEGKATETAMPARLSDKLLAVARRTK